MANKVQEKLESIFNSSNMLQRRPELKAHNESNIPGVYTVLYTLTTTVFGIQALKRWGLDRRDRFQIWRYVSLLSFQWSEWMGSG
jgi:hypothetical protein